MESDFDFIGRGNPIFSRQHHAQVIGQDRTHTIISLFDNAIGTGPNEFKTNSMARGLILLLNTVDWTASILSEYRHPRGSTVSSRGESTSIPHPVEYAVLIRSCRKLSNPGERQRLLELDILLPHLGARPQRHRGDGSSDERRNAHLPRI